MKKGRNLWLRPLGRGYTSKAVLHRAIHDATGILKSLRAVAHKENL